MQQSRTPSEAPQFAARASEKQPHIGLEPQLERQLEPQLEPQLEWLLRVTAEPLQQLSDRQVHQLLTVHLDDYLKYVKNGLGDIGAGRAAIDLPPKQLFQQTGEAGDFRVMPCVRTAADGRVHKTVKLVGTNKVGIQVADQITVGKACYLEPEENFISHQFDACLLSSIRTGACAAIAADYLLDPATFEPTRFAPATSDSSGRDAMTLTLVGAGRVGLYTAWCLSRFFTFSQINVVDRQTERAEALCGFLQTLLPDCRSDVAGSINDCDSRLLVLATDSTRPIFNPDELQPPRLGTNPLGPDQLPPDQLSLNQINPELVISLGADSLDQREIETSPIWDGATLFVDTVDSVRYGDLAAWQRGADQRLVELTELAALTEPGALRWKNRADESELAADGISSHPKLFISTGSALLDNLTMSYLVELLEREAPL